MGLKHLVTLRLASTQITDVGLEHLKRLTSLRYLSLDRTRVTDAGLRHLKALGSLQTVLLEKTQVTEAGVSELRRSLPAARILPTDGGRGRGDF
jgi:hypothetical protein